jgi:flavodoxin
MKSLVVYYSLDGHTRFIADMIAGETGSDVYELQPVGAKSRSGFAKYFWGGKSVMFNEKPKLQKPIPDITQYDLIFIGTPIWASSFAPPIRTFLSKAPLQLKKLMLFASSGSGDAKKCFDKMQAALDKCDIIGEIDFKEPTAHDTEPIKKQVKAWLSAAGL